MISYKITYYAHQAIKRYCKSFYNEFVNKKKNIETYQNEILNEIIKENKHTVFGKKHKFESIDSIKSFQKLIPIFEYEDLAYYINLLKNGKKNVLSSDEITQFVPSSGTSSSSKLIPFNKSLQNDFSKAINIWFYNLYDNFSNIKKGKSFWIVSPIVKPKKINSKVPVKFAEDSQYFNKISNYFISKTMAIPNFLGEINDIDNYFYILSLFLLQQKNISFISVWSPSLWLIILDKILINKHQLLIDIEKGTVKPPNKLNASSKDKIINKFNRNPKRAHFLQNLLNNHTKIEDVNWENIWKTLSVISCWGDSWAKEPYHQIKRIFRNTYCQKKGLLMTEGIVSIPIIDKKTKESKTILTHTIHFYEFKEQNTNKIKLAHQLQENTVYEVIITTKGGLYRYNTHDLVNFKGLHNGFIHLSFIGKSNIVSDLRGEKLNEKHVSKVIESLFKVSNKNKWCFLAPTIQNKRVYYTLFIEQTATFEVIKVEEQLNELLQENIHYKNCISLNQLEKAKIYVMNKSQIKVITDFLHNTNQISTKKNLFLRTNPKLSEIIINSKF